MASGDTWDHEVDLLVVGSGAAAMSAAIRAHDLGLRVLMVEKGPHCGGSTAMSGGVCWVPNNPKMGAQGIEDSDEDALTYLRHITEGEVDDEKLRAYVTGAQRMLAYVEAHTHLRFDALERYTDYYPESPGGRPGGRSMESRPYDGRRLGAAFQTLHPPHPQSQILGRFGITARQAHTLLRGDWRAKLMLLWAFMGYGWRWLRRRRFGRDTHLTTGNALAARLRRSLLDRDVPLWFDAAAESLALEEGRVVGACVLHPEGARRVRARSGVVLAAGGFSRNQAMRQAHQRHPITSTWSAGSLLNVGDGIRMGEAAGGVTALMREAWWTPVTCVPRSELGWVLVVEKNLPGSIFVNRAGRRFTNEAAPYVDVVVGMYEADDPEAPCVPCHMVFDAVFRRKYPCGPVAPGYAMPDGRLPRRYRQEFLVRADSLEELAGAIGVDAEGLVATVGRFNQMAAAGKDEDYGRGESLADRYYGDDRVGPNPCLAPIARPPFYAIEVVAGDLGTKGGLVTDSGARVLNAAGHPIPGLYAAGNCAASMMGRTYPGAGGTIGPALTFGFLAAESASADGGPGPPP